MSDYGAIAQKRAAEAEAIYGPIYGVIGPKTSDPIYGDSKSSCFCSES